MRRKLRGLAWLPEHYHQVGRALERLAVRVRQDRTRPGKPWLWRLRERDMDTTQLNAPCENGDKSCD